MKIYTTLTSALALLCLCTGVYASGLPSERLPTENLLIENLLIENKCADGIGTLFTNCLDPTWKEASAINNHVTQWRVIATEGHHQEVLDITFGDAQNQRFAIYSGALSDPNTPHTWLDLSAFKHGKLVFDLRVMDFADNLNGLEVSLGCGTNCKSAPLGVYPTQQGQWQTVSIELKDLIDSGLEISQVQTGFEIYPVDGEQNGVHLQLDNIRLEAPIPEPMSLVAL